MCFCLPLPPPACLGSTIILYLLFINLVTKYTVQAPSIADLIGFTRGANFTGTKIVDLTIFTHFAAATNYILHCPRKP